MNSGHIVPNGIATSVAVMICPLGQEYRSNAFIDKFNDASNSQGRKR
jgi:hypothetical protein